MIDASLLFVVRVAWVRACVIGAFCALRWGHRWRFLALAVVGLRIRLESGVVSGRTGSLLASGVKWLVSLQVADEDVGRLGGSHGEVNVLCLHDVGVSGPASRVADVVQGDLDGVSGGRGSFSEAVGRPFEPCKRAAPCGLKGPL